MLRVHVAAAFCTAIILLLCSVNAQYDGPEIAQTMEPFSSNEVKCLVCKATINEMKRTISKVDKRKTTDVGGSKKVRLINSESYLTELMETVCKSMDDYAKARYKKTRELTILKFTMDSGSMNPEMSEVDFVYDGDLNKSLEHFCLEILEDHEDVFLEHFMKDELPQDVEHSICYETAEYCPDDDAENDNQREEL